jgi:uncharacterized protein
VIGGRCSKVLAGVAAAAALAVGVPGAAQNYSDGYKFLQAVDKKERGEVDELLARNHTVINSRDLTSGRTGLHIAVERRDVVWLNYLARLGANPNIADARGVTPLMRASQIGFAEGVEALIRVRAQVDTPNSTGETPLILAVHRRDTEMMRVLLGAGADPDRADNSGRSAYDYARLDGRNSATLAEIERSLRAGPERRAGAEVYGPRF